MNSICINDIYEKVINNKIFVNLENNQFEQGNNIMISPKIKDESNYVFELINSFKKKPLKNNKKYSNNTDIINNTNSIIINNSFLYYLSVYIKSNISDIKKNIEKHINDEDFEYLKNKFNSYKKSIQSIKEFLIEDNTDLVLSDSILFYISYLYKITIVITCKNIYKIFDYKNSVENTDSNILIFSKNINQYNFIKHFTNYDEFINEFETNNKILYRSNSELNKLKISDIKNICKTMKIDCNNTKALLIVMINEEFGNF